MFRHAPHTRRRLASATHSVLEILESRQMMSASAVDTTFSGNGRNELPIGDSSGFRAVTVLPNGKSLAVGVVDMDLSANDQDDFLVARYNVDGSLDTTFGNGAGWVHTNFYNFGASVPEDRAVGIVQLPNGKFAVAGTTASAANSEISNYAVAQYNADGSLDNSFSGDGKAVVDFGANTWDIATAMAVTSDYKVLVVGVTQHTPPTMSGEDVGIAKFKSDGTLDTTFGGGAGKVVRDFGSVYGADPNSDTDDQFTDQQATAIHVLSNGTFLIAGSISDAPDFNGPGKEDSFVARLTANGGMDTTFASGKGFVKTSTSSLDEGFDTLAVLPDGKILAGGSTQTNSDAFGFDFLLVRYSSSGVKDTTFGSSGIVRTPFNDFGIATDNINTLLVQPTGKILAVGSTNPEDIEQPERTALARYNANGSLDTGFSGDGKLISGLIPNAGAQGGAMTPDGKLVVVSEWVPEAVIGRFGSDFAATAKISGTFYNDLNGNGARNTGEGALPGWQAFVDTNNDGFWTPGEKIATSDATGKYTITGLTPGTYRIREIRLTNWNRTQPAGAYPLGFYDVTVGLGSSVVGKDFGNKHA